MSSSQPINLKRPWEVESSPTPQSKSHRDSQSSQYSDLSPYGQDISGWQYGSYEGPRQPWNRRTPPISTPHELHVKRTRLELDQHSMFDQNHSAHVKPLSPEQFHAREYRGPHASVSALGPVMSLGYHPKMPSPSTKGASPELARVMRHPGPPVPVLPSPSSIPGTAIPSQTQAQALPPLATNESAISAISGPNHVQDLQHQLSSADVQLKRLQMLHEELKKEHERARARLATYDRKSKTADQELVTLHEEKYCLLDRVTALEKELDETRRQKNEIQELHTREGAQWRKIISLSDTLQKQHSEAAERWSKERGNMTSRIETLEDQVRKMKIASTSGSVDSGSQEGAEDDNAASRTEVNSSAFLTREIQRVRVQEEQARERLREYEQGSQELRDLLAKVKGVMERMGRSEKHVEDTGQE